MSCLSGLTPDSHAEWYQQWSSTKNSTLIFSLYLSFDVTAAAPLLCHYCTTYMESHLLSVSFTKEFAFLPRAYAIKQAGRKCYVLLWEEYLLLNLGADFNGSDRYSVLMRCVCTTLLSLGAFPVSLQKCILQNATVTVALSILDLMDQECIRSFSVLV